MSDNKKTSKNKSLLGKKSIKSEAQNSTIEYSTLSSSFNLSKFRDKVYFDLALKLKEPLTR